MLSATPCRRIVLALLVAVLVAAMEAPARAGGYEVRACTADGETGAWEGAVNNSYGSIHGCAYRQIGLQSAHVGLAGDAPGGSAASLSFHAPGGTWITGIRMEYLLAQGNFWQAGLAHPGGWLLGGPACAGVCGTYPNWGRMELGNLHTGTLTAQIFCQATSCTTQDNSQLAMRDVAVSIHDPSPPSVGNPRGDLWTDRWQAGTRRIVFDSTDNTGIKEARVLIDGRGVREHMRECAPAARTCPDWHGASMDVPTVEFGDGGHTLTLQAIDRGGNAGQASRAVLIDNTPPAAPEDVEVAGGQGWRSSNGYTVSWRNPSQAGRAPIAGAAYRLCPVPAAAGRCEERTASGADLTSIRDLKLPRAGEWTLRVWLVDAAGNAREEYAAAPVTLRLDDDAPQVSILPLAPQDPTRVVLQASDRTSGLRRGDLELRRDGTQSWHTFSGEPTRDGFAAWIDDEHLPDGRYEMRARVADGAGNERSTDRFATGEPARLTLPVRIRSRLVVGRAGRRMCRGRGKRRRCRHRLVARPSVRYGRSVRLHGRLTLPGRQPVANAELEVWEQIELPGAAWRRLSSVRASRTGRFSFRTPKGPARTLRFRYPGTSTIRPRNGDVDLRVRARTSLRSSKRRVVNGEYMTFRGRVRGEPLPANGKLVELQVYTRGHWRTFGQARAKPRSGRWAYRYRFETVRGRARFRFRARVRREDNYPYHTGTSPTTRVTVVGL